MDDLTYGGNAVPLEEAMLLPRLSRPHRRAYWESLVAAHTGGNLDAPPTTMETGVAKEAKG